MKMRLINYGESGYERSGFTLVEIMIVLVTFGLVLIALFSFFWGTQNAWRVAELDMETSFDASLALERIVYGITPDSGIRSGISATCSNTASGWVLQVISIDGMPVSYVYDRNLKTIVLSPGAQTVCEDVSDATAVLTDGGVTLSVTVDRRVGAYDSSITMTTFVILRNMKT